MVADLTRYSACKVHPDTPDRPVRDRNARRPSGNAGQTIEPGLPQEKAGPTGDEPVRLFAWASA